MPLFYVFALSAMIISCSDIILSRYSFVAISFIYQTISRHAAHVALSFVSRYRSVAISFCRDIVRLPFIVKLFKDIILYMSIKTHVRTYSLILV